jgi:hypothetical protein
MTSYSVLNQNQISVVPYHPNCIHGKIGLLPTIPTTITVTTVTTMTDKKRKR